MISVSAFALPGRDAPPRLFGPEAARAEPRRGDVRLPVERWRQLQGEALEGGIFNGHIREWKTMRSFFGRFGSAQNVFESLHGMKEWRHHLVRVVKGDWKRKPLWWFEESVFIEIFFNQIKEKEKL